MSMQRDSEHTENGHVLLRNKPDQGTALGQCVGLGIISMFVVPFFIFWIQDFDPRSFEDILFSFLIFLLPAWIIFVLLVEIYWGFMGSEIVYYSDSAIYIQQKQSFRKDVVIPWDSITDIKPYDEPLLLYGLPTHAPTICITYKKNANKTKKVRFGYHLSPKQRKIVIERIQELLVESFE